MSIPDWCAPVGGTLYTTTGPLTWGIGRKSGPPITVPPGFAFDVSIPRPLWLAFSPHDPRYLRAAAIHDWLLTDGWWRVTAGAVFLEALRADGVGRIRRLLMWLAVSLYRWT
ncbi:MAG: DUF1353 domain-containing protein [Limimaricola sp.]